MAFRPSELRIYPAGTIRALGTFFTTPGMTDELMHAFVATDLQPVGQQLEANEEIEVHTKTPGETWRMIREGESMDAKSMLTVLLYERSASGNHWNEEGTA